MKTKLMFKIALVLLVFQSNALASKGIEGISTDVSNSTGENVEISFRIRTHSVKSPEIGFFPLNRLGQEHHTCILSAKAEIEQRVSLLVKDNNRTYQKINFVFELGGHDIDKQNLITGGDMYGLEVSYQYRDEVGSAGINTVRTATPSSLALISYFSYLEDGGTDCQWLVKNLDY